MFASPRFSDDLDFFLNNDEDFAFEAEKILVGLENVFSGNIQVNLKQNYKR